MHTTLILNVDFQDTTRYLTTKAKSAHGISARAVLAGIFSKSSIDKELQELHRATEAEMAVFAELSRSATKHPPLRVYIHIYNAFSFLFVLCSLS